jgi:hypothetical protein
MVRKTSGITMAAVSPPLVFRDFRKIAAAMVPEKQITTKIHCIFLPLFSK